MPSPSTPPGARSLGAGNKGNVYRIESPTLYTSLLSLPVTQVTAFQAGRDGRLFAATGNTGKVYEIGPGLEHEGSIESDVFDSGMYSLWGRLTYEISLNGGRVAIATRSGNLDRPQKNWSEWAAVPAGAKGGRVASPPARFVQWKATLDRRVSRTRLGGRGVSAQEPGTARRRDRNHSAQLSFPASAHFAEFLASLRSACRRWANAPAPAASLSTSDSTPSMQVAKGFLGARWAASDPNGDPLVYTVEIRGVEREGMEAAQGKGFRPLSFLGFHGLSGWRVPPARDRIRCARAIPRRRR